MPKPGQHREIPPPLELECLKALWVLGEGSVKDVRELVTRDRNLAYTTIMTVLERLARRGGVARRKNGRFFLYSPLIERDVLRRVAVRELVDRFFDGDPRALIRFVDGSHLESFAISEYRTMEGVAVPVESSGENSSPARVAEPEPAPAPNMDTALL